MSAAEQYLADIYALNPPPMPKRDPARDALVKAHAELDKHDRRVEALSEAVQRHEALLAEHEEALEAERGAADRPPGAVSSRQTSIRSVKAALKMLRSDLKDAEKARDDSLKQARNR